MSVGDIHDELPDENRGAKSTIEPTLIAHFGKWVELRHGVAGSAASSYHNAKWVREQEDEGRKVEFAVRNRVLYGRITADDPELF